MGHLVDIAAARQRAHAAQVTCRAMRTAARHAAISLQLAKEHRDVSRHLWELRQRHDPIVGAADALIENRWAEVCACGRPRPLKAHLTEHQLTPRSSTDSVRWERIVQSVIALTHAG